MEAHGLRPALGDNRCRGQPPARKLVRYLRKGQMHRKNIKFWTEPRPCMVLGLKPMGKPSTKFLLLQVLDRTKALYGPRTQTYGETKYKIFYYYKFWTEPRPCMVLGLKPMGKPSTKNKNYKCWTEPRPWMVLGLKPMGKLTARIGKALGSNIVKC